MRPETGSAPADVPGIRRAGFAPFADPGWELRFRRERLGQGLVRTRWALALGLLLVAATAGLEAASATPRPADHERVAFRLRVLVIEPTWAAALLATWWRGFMRVGDAILAAATVLAVWAMALNQWHHCLLHPGEPAAVKMVFALLPPLLISAGAFPLAATAQTAMALAATLGPAVLLAATAPDALRADARTAAASLAAIGAAIAAWGWQREAGERRAFAHREREKAREAELARLTAERNEFLAIAAHDLRAPLATVRGLSAQLQAGRHATDAQRARVHAAIHELAGKMLELVNAYLGAHTAETGSPALQPTRLDLRAAADAARTRHAAAAATKRQTITVEAAGAEPVPVRADATLLAQIADNFVSNALKFSPPGAPVHLRATRRADWARLEVSDAGPGVSPGERAQLFRKFGRTTAKPTGGEPSHGLGLAVAKRLAEAMGGCVGCDSEPGRGATFWVELPAAPDASHAAADRPTN